MDKITRIKKSNLGNLVTVSIIIILMFIVGFLSGGSFIYGLTSQEIDDLQYQIDNIEYDNNNGNNSNEVNYFSTYYYNETSLSDIYKNVKESIIVISGIAAYQTFWRTQYYEVQGSGFVYQFENQMVVITNNHVVADVSDIVVTFSNGNGYSGEVIGSDAYSDLAILSIDAPLDEFKPLEIISSSDIEVGNPVIAIGSPMGLENTMTIGIISQLGRTIEESAAGSFPIANIIQTSAAINAGNSGGPLLNYQGEVIGITTAIIEDSEGLGFAIPSNTILKEVESLIKSGSYDEHPWLGISGTDMSYAIAEEIEVDVTYGWLIAGVSSGSAAKDAGLLGGNKQVRINDDLIIIGGDIIIEIDGFRIINGDSLMSYLEEFTNPGQTIIISIIRENQFLDVPVEVGVRPII